MTIEILIFIFILIFVTMATYFAIDNEPTSLLKERLDKMAEEGESKENTNKIEDFKNFILIFLKPLLTSLVKEKKDKKTIKQLLMEAGQASNEDDILKFVALRLYYTSIALVVSLFLLIAFKFNLNAVLIAVSLTALAYLAPILSLKSKAKKRVEDISYNLPDALDLLTVCVEAGLGLDAALSRVAKEYSRKSAVLATEIGRVSNDVLAGIPRQEAFRNLADRNNVSELRSFVALLIQTDRLGTSIAQSLRVYCDTVRTRRKQRVEELAQKASVKMIVPLVFFILPAMFVVILAPAAISLMGSMK